jgi:16S rRNA A1518/A1519 N6-dimethyltransferase RsmA/KsgA/DIM1 with predicted DNA glycosylase/AP lyase activity
LKGLLRESDFEACGIDPERRPETLEPADFGRLAVRYCQNTGAA